MARACGVSAVLEPRGLAMQSDGFEGGTKLGVQCAKTACAYLRQALRVEFVNNRGKTIAKGVAKAISRHGDGVHDNRVKCPL